MRNNCESNPMKKILIIANSFYVTGGFNSIRNLTENLKDEVEFVFAIPEGSQVEEILKKEGYSTYVIKRAGINKSLKLILYPFILLYSAFQLISIYRKEKCDIVHVNDLTNMNGVLAKLIYPKLRLVYHIRLLKSSYIKLLYPFYSSLVLFFSDKVIAVSQAVMADLPNRDNLVQVYNIITPECLEIQWNGLSSPSKIRVLYLGNYTPGKYQHLAIEAFEIFVQKFPDAELHFYGDSSLKNLREYKDKLSATVISKGLDKNIVLNDKTNDVEKLMKSFDIVLNLSISESFSLVTIEAMKYGVPVIVYNSGGPKEITENGKRAILLNNLDPVIISDAIEEIANNRKKYIELAASSKSWINEKFDKEVTIKKMKNIYNELII